MRRRRTSSSVSTKAILAAIPDMLFRIDRDGCYLEFKPAEGLKPLGEPDEFLGHTMTEVLPAGFAVEGLVTIRQVLGSGEAQTHEYQIREEEGLAVYEARIVPLAEDEVLIIVRLMSRMPEAGTKYALTKREMAVLQAVASGRTDKGVAAQLSISPLTVRKHVASIRKKMGAQSRTEASVRAVKEGLVT